MKNTLIILIAASLAFSCGKDAKQEKVTNLEGEVLTIHDEVMPKMDEIMSLKSKLTNKIQEIDSLQNVGVSSNSLAERRIKATELNQKLSDSDKAMMEWMHGYAGDSAKKLEPDAAINYFESEREKILVVKQTTNKSIQDAKTFLE